MGQVSRYFALIALLIACLGLYGLASHTAENRTRKIGICKVLGASVPRVFGLLAKNFIGLATIAILIAWPLGYLITNSWLQNYAYRTALSWSIFAIAAASALLIVLLTVSYHALRTALANPVDALRNE